MRDWAKTNGLNIILDEPNEDGTLRGFYLSYLENDFGGGYSTLDNENPETAIVIRGDKKNGNPRYLIYRGDWREELEEIYPDLEKLKNHWREFGGHFWSDDLED